MFAYIKKKKKVPSSLKKLNNRNFTESLDFGFRFVKLISLFKFH